MRVRKGDNDVDSKDYFDEVAGDWDSVRRSFFPDRALIGIFIASGEK